MPRYVIDWRVEVERLREALERIRDLTPQAANTVSADGHHGHTRVIALTALATEETDNG